MKVLKMNLKSYWLNIQSNLNKIIEIQPYGLA